MSLWNLLVVDDDELVRDLFRENLPESWEIQEVSKGSLSFCDSFHGAFVDMHLSSERDKTEGLHVISNLRKYHPHMDIVAMSGNLNPELMEASLKAGASRYLAKPLNLEEVHLILNKMEAWCSLQKNNRVHSISPHTWVGNGPSSRQVKKKIAELRGEAGPFLIEGESGTGKEVVAHLLHQQDSQGPLVCLNVAAFPENLFESEFFGYEKGAFTGAYQSKMGLAEAAHGGDLFLDEIEALSPVLQAKLLRFLETGEIQRLGSRKPIYVKTRILVATNKSLQEMVERGEFRDDLLWRLKGQRILLPSLKERKEDIALLCVHFFSKDFVQRRKKLSSEALELLRQHPWPGNVRELKRVCEHILLYAPLPIVRKKDVQPFLVSQEKNSPSKDFVFWQGDLQDRVQRFEKEVIEFCLKDTQSIEKTRKILKISRSNLYKKIKTHNISWRSYV